MSDSPFPEELTPPRLAGIREQVARAQMHVHEALASADSTTRFRKLVAAIYPGRAALEIMRDAAVKGELRVGDDELVKQVGAVLPHHELIYLMRLHDFHRFAVMERPGRFISGPLYMRASKRGAANIQFLQSGHQIKKRGNAHVKLDRPLQMESGRVFDESSNQWVPMDQAIQDYVKALPSALEIFERLRR